jgi:hypothetical protein
LVSEINIISAPDTLDRDSKKFLLFDISMDELVEVKDTFTNFDMNIDFYIYGSYSKDIKWVSKVVEAVDYIIINSTQLTEHVDLKQELLEHKNSVRSGDKTVLELILERCQ